MNLKKEKSYIISKRIGKIYDELWMCIMNCGAGEDSWESLRQQKDQTSQSQRKSDAEAPIYWPPVMKRWLTGKDSKLGKDRGQDEKGLTDNEMVGWHHWFSGHEFEQIPGDKWRTGKHGMLQFMGLKRVGHDLVTEQQWWFMN